MKPLAVTGLGVCSPLGVGRAAFFEGLSRKEPPKTPLASFDASSYPDARALEVPDFDPASVLGDKGIRSLDRLTKLLLVAARHALEDSGLKTGGAFGAVGPERVGAVCSNAYGSLEAITELNRVAQLEAPRYINPAKFPNTVSNSAAGYVSIWEDLRALNVSVSDGNCGGLDAVGCADVFFSAGRADALLVGGGEAMSEALLVAFEKLGALKSGCLLGEGALFVATESPAQAASRGANVLGILRGFGTAFSGPSADGPLLYASEEGLERAIDAALVDAALAASDVECVVSGLSGVETFDRAELTAIARRVGPCAVTEPKKLVGETLGAGGAFGMGAALSLLSGGSAGPLRSGALPSRVNVVLVTSLGFYGNASAVVLTRA